MSNSKGRPVTGGPAERRQTLGGIVTQASKQQWVIAEAHALDNAKAFKAELLRALGMPPPSPFDFEMCRRLIQWDRMISAHGKRPA